MVESSRAGDLTCPKQLVLPGLEFPPTWEEAFGPDDLLIFCTFLHWEILSPPGCL